LQTDFATLQNEGLDFSAFHGLEKKAAADPEEGSTPPWRHETLAGFRVSRRRYTTYCGRASSETSLIFDHFQGNGCGFAGFPE
jgi:hypothetical protein